MGAGVPCPVHPKSQMHRNATAKPRIEGTVAIQRHRAVSTWKPNHGGSNQNHRAKKPVPTANEANAAGQCEPRSGTGAVPVCSLVTTASTTPKYAPTAQTPATKKPPPESASICPDERRGGHAQHCCIFSSALPRSSSRRDCGRPSLGHLEVHAKWCTLRLDPSLGRAHLQSCFRVSQLLSRMNT